MLGSRVALALTGFLSLIGIAVACSDDAPADAIAVPDGGPTTTGTGACPCTVGDGGDRLTISCGGAQCVVSSGVSTGYRCEDDGAHVDNSICASTSSSTSGGPCVAATCADLHASCGNEISDGCGSLLTCPSCPSGHYCEQDLAVPDTPGTTFACVAKADNVAVFGAAQGGTFTIDVDENVPNLAIGITSAGAVNVTLTGQYLANVVAVFYAGASPAVLINGVGTKSFIVNGPSGARVDAGGAEDAIDCEEPSDAGAGDAGAPCNPPAQVGSFFASSLGGSLLFNRCQNDAFTGTLKVSDHGTCP